MITERHEELAALRALGLLEEPERLAFRAERSADPQVEALARSLENSATYLALAAPARTPPPELKARILAACTGPGRTASPPTPLAPVTPFPLLRLIPWAAAALLTISTAWLVSQNLALRSANDALLTQQRLAQVAYETAQNQLAERSLLAETMINDLGSRLRRSEDLARLKVSALASLAGNTAEAQAIAVWDPEQQAGLLTFEKLPVIADSQDYQIWVVDPAYQNPVNGGVFHVAADGRVVLAFRPDQPVTKATAFAISLEKKGGVPKAEGPIVLLGKLPSI
ncbi:Anti-sigma-K factor rskA [Lacunisphaera limnophila]|uniref:Anti-sigma-K factor rskA n=1 Tax=Lacunisphaera limnophila TaxID=1838286 RepID=A0A1D8AX10_9BACT|nr:anti-sigma factor [Lacunisphaera limnophila]AOS45435.1 Anti-sigma-K factor rskA [Lacunisphaera limnophila]